MKAETAFFLGVLMRFGGMLLICTLTTRLELCESHFSLQPSAFGLRSAQVGNMDRVEVHVTQRMKAFSPKAQAFGLKPPKGVLLAGPPGTGKTYMAQAIAAQFGLPCLIFDLSKMVDQMLGQTEKNVNAGLAMAEAVEPCVLVIDEIEKLFGGQGSNAGDGRGGDGGGTMERVFGKVLSWLSKPGRQVYVVGTSNVMRRLPPELVRSGRFDKIFFVDLPEDAEARLAILHIHLKQVQRDPASFAELMEIAEQTVEFSGAELEQVIQDALTLAFDDGDGERDVTTADMRAAARAIVPLARTRADAVAAMRQALREDNVELAATPRGKDEGGRMKAEGDGRKLLKMARLPSRFEQLDEE